MQRRYEEGIRNMESRIEEIQREITFRADFLAKELLEIERVKADIEGQTTYLGERKQLLQNKKDEYDNEIKMNRKL